MTPSYPFPILSPDGTRVLSGSGTVTLDGTPLWQGWSPAWRSATRILWNGGPPGSTKPGTWEHNLATKATMQIDPLGHNQVAGGGNRYALCRSGRWLKLSGQPRMDGAYFDPSVDDNGDCAWRVDAGVGHQHLFVRPVGKAAGLVVDGPVIEPKLRHGTLLFRRVAKVGGVWKGRTWGMRLGIDAAPMLVSPTQNQYGAVPVLTAAGLFILAFDEANRLLLYPFGASVTTGYIVATGTTLQPDARVLTGGLRVRVVAWKQPGLLDKVVDVTKPMVTL